MPLKLPNNGNLEIFPYNINLSSQKGKTMDKIKEFEKKFKDIHYVPLQGDYVLASRDDLLKFLNGTKSANDKRVDHYKNLAFELMGAILLHGNISKIGKDNCERWTKMLDGPNESNP